MPIKNGFFKKLTVVSFILYGYFFINTDVISAVSCSEDMTIRISNDRKNFSQSITITPDFPRYYIKSASTAGGSYGPCSTQFKVRTSVCDLTSSGGKANCSEETEASGLWGGGYYKSGNNGIARIDMDVVTSEPLQDKKVIVARFLPSNLPSSSLSWSNYVNIKIDSAKENSLINAGVVERNINLLDYYHADPGDTYIYTTENNIYDITGSTYLQIEEDRDWGGFTVRPWRFVKDVKESYWDAKAGNNRPGNLNIRWMIASPNYTSLFSDLIWGVGDKRYTMPTPNKLSNLGSFSNGYLYSTSNNSSPAYHLGPKVVTLPYVFRNSGTSNYRSYNDSGFSPKQSDLFRGSGTGEWKIRIERDPLPKYPDAIRVDFYEGAYPLETAGFHRETWWLAKNIGMVKISQKFFNGYGNIPSAVPCLNTIDCLSDSVRSPNIEVTLDKFYSNSHKFDVSVAVSNTDSYLQEVYTNKKLGYTLKINNSGYTGYLEASGPNSGASKWHWVEDGKVYINDSVLEDLGNSEYESSFRIWAPNDLFLGESSVRDTSIPWSNYVKVNLLPVGDLNGDFGVNSTDILIFSDHLFKNSNSNLKNDYLLDMNVDDSLNLIDLISLLNSI